MNTQQHVYEVYGLQAVAPFALVGLSRQWVQLSYTRRYQATGEFSLTVPEEAPELLGTAVTPPLLYPNAWICVYRDGSPDFFGVITDANYTEDENSPDSSLVTFTGWDLSGYLFHRRAAVPPGTLNYYGVTDTGGNVLRQIVTDHLIAPFDTTRKVSGLALGTGVGLGQTVVINLHGDQLDDIAAKVALAGEVGYSTTVASSQVQFNVYQGIDRTSGSNTVTFNAAYSDLYKFQWGRSLQNYVNRVYTMGGDGNAASRFTTVSNDAAGQALWGIWEGFQDGTNAVNVAIATAQGAAYLASKGQIDRISFIQRETSSVAYHTNWDLGDTVNVVNAKWGLDLSFPIIEAQITVNASVGEEITLQLNTWPPSVIRTLRTQLAGLAPKLYQPGLVILSDGRVALASLASAPVPSGISNPLAPGNVYYNSASGIIQYWNGTTWKSVTAT